MKLEASPEVVSAHEPKESEERQQPHSEILDCIDSARSDVLGLIEVNTSEEDNESDVPGETVAFKQMKQASVRLKHISESFLRQNRPQLNHKYRNLNQEVHQSESQVNNRCLLFLVINLMIDDLIIIDNIPFLVLKMQQLLVLIKYLLSNYLILTLPRLRNVMV